MSEELKPCPVPWCGGRGYIPARETQRRYVCCEKCGACGPNTDFVAEAIAAWNCRPSDSVMELAQKVADAWRDSEFTRDLCRNTDIELPIRALAVALPRKL